MYTVGGVNSKYISILICFYTCMNGTVYDIPSHMWYLYIYTYIICVFVPVVILFDCRLRVSGIVHTCSTGSIHSCTSVCATRVQIVVPGAVGCYLFRL